MEIIIILIVVLLAIAGLCMLLVSAIDSWGESKMGKDGWENFQKAVQEDQSKKKYNNYEFKCPMCGSTKVKKISDLNRATSVAMLGVASSKIGKQYECDNCNHKW